MKCVVIESPLSAKSREQMEDNKDYAKRCALDCLKRGESPYASHLFFDQPGLLNDMIPEDRNLGMNAGMYWGAKADLVAVYTDLGISPGMEMGIRFYQKLGLKIEHRSLDAVIKK